MSSAIPWRPEFVDKYDTFLCDCDGVLWRGKKLLPGSQEMVEKLKAMGKRVLFCTNNSSLSRAQYQSKLTRFGYTCKPTDIYCTAFAAASFLAAHPDFNKETDKAFVIGGEGILLEMAEYKIQGISATTLFGKHHLSREAFDSMHVDPAIKAVVVGFDGELTYTKVAYAMLCLTLNPDCIFISTNQDKTFPQAERVLPGGGSCVQFVATGAQKVPLNTGKPEPVMMELAQTRHQFNPKRTIMVGDRLDTDILFGQRANVSQLLVFSGVTQEKDLHSPDNDIHPTYAVHSFGKLLDPHASTVKAAL